MRTDSHCQTRRARACNHTLAKTVEGLCGVVVGSKSRCQRVSQVSTRPKKQKAHQSEATGASEKAGTRRNRRHRTRAPASHRPQLKARRRTRVQRSCLVAGTVRGVYEPHARGTGSASITCTRQEGGRKKVKRVFLCNWGLNA